MNLHPVDVRRELRQGVQRRFDLGPVVIFLPITREFAHRRELHALRCICHRFQLRPLCRGDPPAEVRQRFVGHRDMERGGSTSPLRSRLLRPRRGSRSRALAQRSRRHLPQNTSFRAGAAAAERKIPIAPTKAEVATRWRLPIGE
jgi:hypothetical protein